MKRLLPLLLLVACGPIDPFAGYDGRVDPRVGGECALPGAAELREVLVVYDDGGPEPYLGSVYAQQLLNLLGHFPEVRGRAVATAAYDGGIQTADVVFYIGANWGEEFAPGLANEFATTTATVVWMGWNLWQLTDQPTFVAEHGFRFLDADGGVLVDGQPQFFRTVHYKGQELVKWYRDEPELGIREFDAYVGQVAITEPMDVQVLAEIEHSGTAERIPYVVRNDNFFYVADIPFTYQHATDRYLAIADLMHDFVGIDHPPSKTALMRLEDVHPVVEAINLDRVSGAMAGRPWALALIPEFQDPLGLFLTPEPKGTTMLDPERGDWRDAIEAAMANGASLILHGYTHQYLDTPNPRTALTGDDYEFWDALHDLPLPGDSYDLMAERVARGQWLLRQQGWVPWAFEYPHYAASLTDRLSLKDQYCTVYHQGEYWDWETGAGGWSDLFEQGPDAVQTRSLTAVTPRDPFRSSQFFPYTIHRDVYGQRVIPENLGNFSPERFSVKAIDVTLAQDLVDRAEANLVNRCAFASFFFHPHLIAAEGIEDGTGEAALAEILSGIEALGYEFADARTLFAD